MSVETGFSKDRMAVTQWLKKKPQDHFARRIPSPELLSEPFRTLLLQALMPDESLQWMVELPPQGIVRHKRRKGWFWKIWFMWELTPRWLVALTGHRLLMIRATGNDGNTLIVAIPVEDILYLEQGMILLFSWVEVHWIENGAAREETLYYDSVSEEVILPLIQMLRRSIAGRPASESCWADEKHQEAQLDRKMLQRLPLKFRNMIPRYGLLDEEHIFQVIYRPVQWRSLMGLARVMAFPRLVVLRTDASLILAAEDLSSTDVSYGLTLTFLSVQYFHDIQVVHNGKRCSLNIRLEAGQTARDWSIPFPLDMEEEVREFSQTREENLSQGNQTGGDP